MQKIFITSSGTNIGKTLITCAFAKALKNNGKKIHAVKPIISGFDFNQKPNDISLICGSLNIDYSKKNLKLINHISFQKPLSPDMATRVEGRKQIDYRKLKSFLLSKDFLNYEYLLVETAGGICVPINNNKLTLNLIKDSADKIILVVGSYLGSLSHTITTYNLLKNAGKPPSLLIVTQNISPKDKLFIPIKETIKSLENFIAAPIIGLEKIAGNEVAKINKISKKLSDEQIYKIFR